ncbi:uncharacterized protein ACIGJ3_021716 [Trichechus inunguis]
MRSLSAGAASGCSRRPSLTPERVPPQKGRIPVCMMLGSQASARAPAGPRAAAAPPDAPPTTGGAPPQEHRPRPKYRPLPRESPFPTFLPPGPWLPGDATPAPFRRSAPMSPGLKPFRGPLSLAPRRCSAARASAPHGRSRRAPSGPPGGGAFRGHGGLVGPGPCWPPVGPQQATVTLLGYPEACRRRQREAGPVWSRLRVGTRPCAG